MRVPLFTLALICTLTGAAGAQAISGIPHYVDADSGTINGIKFRAHGYDAPEWDQVGYRGEPLHRYRCCLWAKDELLGLTAGQPTDCDPVVQENGGTTDSYGHNLISTGKSAEKGAPRQRLRALSS